MSIAWYKTKLYSQWCTLAHPSSFLITKCLYKNPTLSPLLGHEISVGIDTLYLKESMTLCHFQPVYQPPHFTSLGYVNNYCDTSVLSTQWWTINFCSKHFTHHPQSPHGMFAIAEFALSRGFLKLTLHEHVYRSRNQCKLTSTRK